MWENLEDVTLADLFSRAFVEFFGQRSLPLAKEVVILVTLLVWCWLEIARE